MQESKLFYQKTILLLAYYKDLLVPDLVLSNVFCCWLKDLIMLGAEVTPRESLPLTFILPAYYRRASQNTWPYSTLQHSNNMQQLMRLGLKSTQIRRCDLIRAFFPAFQLSVQAQLSIKTFLIHGIIKCTTSALRMKYKNFIRYT